MADYAPQDPSAGVAAPAASAPAQQETASPPGSTISNGLGIDCIWIPPFFPSPERDGGYDVQFLTAYRCSSARSRGCGPRSSRRTCAAYG